MGLVGILFVCLEFLFVRWFLCGGGFFMVGWFVGWLGFSN